MSEGSMRRRHSTAALALAAPFPENDDLLREILLRLPPFPSSLPRASLVSKRWRRILSDPQFLRRFRAFHHRRAPLLGFFIGDSRGNLRFTPTLDPPNRIPSARFSLALPRDYRPRLLGCRHGLVLILRPTRLEITVWDPVAGDQRCVALPPGFNSQYVRLAVRSGAVLCDCDDHAGGTPLESFKVVVLWSDDVLLGADHHVFAFLYESKAGVWSNIISASIRAPLWLVRPSILVGNSLYWLLLGYGRSGILKFNLDMKNLSVIDSPPDAQFSNQCECQILRMGDSRLGYAIAKGFNIQVWENKSNSQGVAKWMLHKTINLDNLLSLGSTGARSWIDIRGYDEDGNAVFVSMDRQVFMIELKSLKFKSVSKTDCIYHPFTGLYTRHGLRQ